MLRLPIAGIWHHVHIERHVKDGVIQPSISNNKAVTAVAHAMNAAA